MTGKDIETKLREVCNCVSEMCFKFEDLESMVDCDELPQKDSNYTIKFVKKGEAYICPIESKNWDEIYPKDLMPAIDCFKPYYKDILQKGYGKCEEIKKMLDKIDALARKDKDF